MRGMKLDNIIRTLEARTNLYPNCLDGFPAPINWQDAPQTSAILPLRECLRPRSGRSHCLG